MDDSGFVALLLATLVLIAWSCYARRIAREDFSTGRARRFQIAALGSLGLALGVLLPGKLHLCDRGVPVQLPFYAGVSWFLAAWLARPGLSKRRALAAVALAYVAMGEFWLTLIHSDRFIGNPNAWTVKAGRSRVKMLWHTPLTGIYGLETVKEMQHHEDSTCPP